MRVDRAPGAGQFPAMPSVALILTPLFASIGLGVLSGVLRLFGAAEARVLSRFVFLIAMPVAVLDFMRETEPPGPDYAGLIAGYLAAMAVTAGIALVLCRRALGLTTREAGAAVFATVCGNAVFLGLPIAFSVEGWAPPFLILMLLEGIFVFALGTALMTWPLPGEAPPRGGVAGTAAGASLRASRNPIVIATLTGLALAVLRADLPAAADGFLDLFGGIAGPAGLFVLGLYVAILPREQAVLSPRPLGVLLPVKLALFPALTGLFVWLFTRDQTFTAVGLLFTGLPPAVASVVQSAHYRQYEAGTAALVAGGTVVGLGTVTVMLGVLLSV